MGDNDVLGVDTGTFHCGGDDLAGYDAYDDDADGKSTAWVPVTTAAYGDCILTLHNAHQVLVGLLIGVFVSELVLGREAGA